MSVHNHPAQIESKGLADDCDRCAELAADPFTGLDPTNLALLAARTREWMADREFPTSANEATAMRAMERHLVHQRILDRAESQEA